jgi:hypothetical protein
MGSVLYLVNEMVISPYYGVRLASHTTRRYSFPNGVFRIVRSDRRMVFQEFRGPAKSLYI